MIELPEAIVLAKECETLIGKRVQQVCPPTSPHRFCFYSMDAQNYQSLLQGKSVIGCESFGLFVQLVFEEQCFLAVCDGVKLRYYNNGEDAPSKYQLKIVFFEGDCLVFTVGLYGSIALHQNDFENEYFLISKRSVSVISDEMTSQDILAKMDSEEKNISAKAFLATKQRFPGIGNGVALEVLYQAHIHPKQKIKYLSQKEKEDLAYALKEVPKEMAEMGGRDTENFLLGQAGGYRMQMSKKGALSGCEECGAKIAKENFLGGSIYYCPHCQKLHE